jgi:zinc-ribbon domain
MYCTQCGNQLPENASFCPRCGTHQQGSTPHESVPRASTAVPVAIKSATIWLEGVHASRKQGGFLSSQQFDGRTFGVAIYLVDSRGDWTACPGKFYLVLRGTEGGPMTDLVASKSSIHKARTRTEIGGHGVLVFYNEVLIGPADFTWNRDHTRFGYAYEKMDGPIWVERTHRSVFAYCWFEFDNGKLLYQKSSYCVDWSA